MKNTSLARFASLVLIFALIVPSTSSAFIEGVSAGSAALGAPAPVGSVAPGLASSAAGSSVSSLQCAACQMNPELPLFCPEVTCFDPLGVVGLCAAQGFCGRYGCSY